MASPKEEKEDPPDESWMGTFADTITLLMAFFVMLLTFSEFDIPAYEELSSAMAPANPTSPPIEVPEEERGAITHGLEDVDEEFVSLVLRSLPP